MKAHGPAVAINREISPNMALLWSGLLQTKQELDFTLSEGKSLAHIMTAFRAKTKEPETNFEEYFIFFDGRLLRCGGAVSSFSEKTGGLIIKRNYFCQEVGTFI